MSEKKQWYIVTADDGAGGIWYLARGGGLTLIRAKARGFSCERRAADARARASFTQGSIVPAQRKWSGGWK